MAQYLDLTGLSKYDELIKALISKADSELGSRIDAGSYTHAGKYTAKVCSIGIYGIPERKISADDI